MLLQPKSLLDICVVIFCYFLQHHISILLNQKVYNIRAQGHFFYVSHRMSMPRRILSASTSGDLKPCSLVSKEGSEL